MPRKPKGSVQVAFRLTPEQVAKLDETAARFRVDRVQVVRWYLDEMPDKYVPAQFESPSGLELYKRAEQNLSTEGYRKQSNGKWRHPSNGKEYSFGEAVVQVTSQWFAAREG